VKKKKSTLVLAGHEDAIIFHDSGYSNAIRGITADNRVVYDFDEMVTWLVEAEGFTTSRAVEHIDDLMRAAGPNGPIVVFKL
jgi:hypothetical protein